MALHGDSAAPTAVGHDPGHAEVFARQLAALGRRGDCAIALSTSGRSPNVLRGLECARQLGLHTVALLGRDGGPARLAVKHPIVVPHEDPAHPGGACLHRTHLVRPDRTRPEARRLSRRQEGPPGS